MRLHLPLIAVSLALVLSGCKKETSLLSCADELSEGVRPFARERDQRFLGKVQQNTARCRGGARAVARRDVPWLDWSNYFATGGPGTRSSLFTRNHRGINGALIDLEYERVELIKFNLFDNSGTYPALRRAAIRRRTGRRLKTWPEMRLPPDESELRRRSAAPARAALQGRADPGPHAHRHLQRHAAIR